ncbi:MAG: sigma-70 family RNA polymerase sigma factor [Anaerolineae bacterium]|nr:sigma-70 family RNA polymerase sigma factor [Anaerolineae bacterium]
MCGDAALAEDAAHECFIRAWQHLHSYRPQSPFRTWLCRIAANCAISELRRAKPVLNVEDHPLSDDRRGPEAGAELKERAAAVQAAILALPATGRSTMILREYEGLSHRNIAETLEIPIGTVMSRLNYARRRLRDALAGYMEVAPRTT